MVFTEWKGSSLGWRWPDPLTTNFKNGRGPTQWLHLLRKLWHGKDTKRNSSMGSCWTIVLRQKDWYQYQLFSTECHGETFAEEGHPVLSNAWGADWGWRQPKALLLGSRHGVCSPIRFWVWLTWDFCTPSPLDSKIAEWVSNYYLSQKMTGAGTNCLFSMFFLDVFTIGDGKISCESTKWRTWRQHISTMKIHQWHRMIVRCWVLHPCAPCWAFHHGPAASGTARSSFGPWWNKWWRLWAGSMNQVGNARGDWIAKNPK